VDPEDPSSIAAGIERVLDDPALAARMARAGLERSRRFDWETAARETLALYEKLLGRRAA